MYDWKKSIPKKVDYSSGLELTLKIPSWGNVWSLGSHFIAFIETNTFWRMKYTLNIEVNDAILN